MKKYIEYLSLPISVIVTLIIVLITIFSLAGCGNQNDKKLESDIGSHQAISLDSVEIYYEVHGEGNRALVFVHCWSCDNKYWDSQVEEFKDEYKVVTIDLAGHGESGLDREKWDMQHYGADVASVINLFYDHEVILVGHSMGGAVCIEAAHQSPGMVTAIVGVDTYQDFSQRFSDQQIEMFLASFKADFPASTNQFVRSIFGLEADSSLVNWVADDMSSAPPEIAISSISELLRYDAISALKEMRLPIRAINADRFPTDVEGNDSIAESFQVKYMPGLGHFVHMEDSENFNLLLREVISEFWPQ
jgi:pimeloyl-ACP methyl ester carboxylesterase